MTDTIGSLPSPTSSQQLAAAQGKIGLGKIVSALLIGGLSSYIMNQLSLHGVNFELNDVIPGVKMSSEFVKSTLEGTLEGAAVWLTPAHFMAAIVDFIRAFKRGWKTIVDAIKAPVT